MNLSSNNPGKNNINADRKDNVLPKENKPIQNVQEKKTELSNGNSQNQNALSQANLESSKSIEDVDAEEQAGSGDDSLDLEELEFN
jgi:hypothetical protein